MRVLILYNVAEVCRKGVPSDLVCEREITVIVPLVANVLCSLGHHVETFATGFDLWEELKQRKQSIDIVFNLAEAFGGENTNEPLVPAMLEALRIPFTGASSHNMYFTLDKEKTKLVLAAQGIPVVPYQLFRTSGDTLQPHLRFPLIAKPVREEASIGIYYDSVVFSEHDLRCRVSRILDLYRQPALVEQFIEGREISVGVVGNMSSLHIFPPLEFLFPEARSPYEGIRSYEYKWGGQREQMARAALPEDTIRQLLDYTRTAFAVSDCRDYARMDYRVATNGHPYLLEVNYNPGIGPNTNGLNNTLTMMASFEGSAFEDLIATILDTAVERYRLTSCE